MTGLPLRETKTTSSWEEACFGIDPRTGGAGPLTRDLPYQEPSSSRGSFWAAPISPRKVRKSWFRIDPSTLGSVDPWSGLRTRCPWVLPSPRGASALGMGLD